MGVIHGCADGSFGPDNPVTYAEAVTMLIRAVSGHVSQVPARIWPYNYLSYGVDAGFAGAVDVRFANLPCTRGDMAVNGDSGYDESWLVPIGAWVNELTISLGADGLAKNIDALCFETYSWIGFLQPPEDHDATDDTAWTQFNCFIWGEGSCPIPGDCRVTIDGAAAEPDDLAEFDAVLVARDWRSG